MSRFTHTVAGEWSYVTDTETGRVLPDADDLLPGQARAVADNLNTIDDGWSDPVAFDGTVLDAQTRLVRRGLRIP